MWSLQLLFLRKGRSFLKSNKGRTGTSIFLAFLSRQLIEFLGGYIILVGQWDKSSLTSWWSTPQDTACEQENLYHGPREQASQDFAELWIISHCLQSTVTREIRVGDYLHSCFEGLGSACRRWLLMLLKWDLTACNSWWEVCNMSNGFLCSEIIFFMGHLIKCDPTVALIFFSLQKYEYNIWSKSSLNTSLRIV